MSEGIVDLFKIPENTEEQMKRAMLRVSREPVARNKERGNIYLDADIVAYLRA